MLMYGHVMICILYALTAAFSYMDEYEGTTVIIIIFKFLFETTLGPVVWLYVAETTQDLSLSFSLFNMWLASLILSTAYTFLMAALGPKILKPLFISFSIISFFGCIYCCHFIKETYGLTDK